MVPDCIVVLFVVDSMRVSVVDVIGSDVSFDFDISVAVDTGEGVVTIVE